MEFFQQETIGISAEVFSRGHGLEFIGLYSYIKYLESKGVNSHEIYRIACLQHEDAHKWIEGMESIGLTSGIKDSGI